MSAAADLRQAVVRHCASRWPAVAARTKVLLDISEPPRRTGELHSSQSIRPSVGPLSLSLEVEYTSIHANYTNEGTSAHTIVPRNKRALFWPGADHPVRRVSHPGNRGTRWFDRAVRGGGWNRILSDVFS